MAIGRGARVAATALLSGGALLLSGSGYAGNGGAAGQQPEPVASGRVASGNVASGRVASGGVASGEPWFRFGLWGGWAGASLSQVEDDTDAYLKGVHLGTTDYFAAAGTPASDYSPSSDFTPAAAGMSLGVEAGFLLTRGVMVETSGGRPRDVWLGARAGFLRPGDVTGSFRAFNSPGEGARVQRTTSTSLTTILIGGWFQGGDLNGFHGRVSFFAGPAFARGEIREEGERRFPAYGEMSAWDRTRRLSGTTVAYAAGLEVACAITERIAVFIDGEYHWARFKRLKENGGILRRDCGLEATYDFSGAGVNGGLKFSLLGGGAARGGSAAVETPRAADRK